jgi:hypothetical protein
VTRLLQKVLLTTMVTLIPLQLFAQEPPKMKMTTEQPPGVATPNRLETRIGTLELVDGVPTPETIQKVYDNLDFQRAVQAYLINIPVAAMSGMHGAIVGFGPPNKTAILFENLMDAKSLWLTPNATTIYMMSWLEMKDEPMVIEIPPKVLGFLNSNWNKYVADFGLAGADKGKGGKYLIVPPGYDKKLPDGYHVVRSNTYGNWVFWRGFQVDDDPAPAVAETKKFFRIYPLSAASNPPEMNFVNVSGTYHNAIHRTDFGIFEEINEVVQAEPPEFADPEILGLLASIGIRHGQPFNPDARMKKILVEAAAVGAATVRTVAARPRDDLFYVYPGESVWTTPFPGGSQEFIQDGARLLDARSMFHFLAAGLTPAMATKMVGRGSQYIMTHTDSKFAPLSGSNTYSVHLPANVPAKDFWSFTVYDNQTRSWLQTDQQFPALDGNKEGLVQNEDGSYDVFIGPAPPKGMENNWIQTIPGRGWNMMFRLYGPLESWFDKSWRPGEPELVK